ncbi:MAG: peptidylprolyl isomerase [Anaerolineales bacterium]
MRKAAFLLPFLFIWLVSCRPDVPLPIFTPSAFPSPTPFLPTPTSVPAIAIVNGEPIPLAEFQAELQRYRQAQEEAGAPYNESEARQVVLNAMIDEVLLAQAARQAGFRVTDVLLQSRIEALVAQRGGMDAFRGWMASYGYDEDSFRRALARAIEAAWMRDQIIAKVPTQAEQVHIKQILFYNEQEAQQVWQQLQNGADFSALARQYDPLTGGDLGWFPRGYLLDVIIDETAFRLQPGQYSEVLKSEIGYHIIEVIERSMRPLSARALHFAQQRALQDWLRQQREQGVIQIVP